MIVSSRISPFAQYSANSLPTCGVIFKFVLKCSFLPVVAKIGQRSNVNPMSIHLMNKQMRKFDKINLENLVVSSIISVILPVVVFSFTPFIRLFASLLVILCILGSFCLLDCFFFSLVQFGLVCLLFYS